MATVVAVDVPGEPRTWTVLGGDWLPVAPVEEFLEFLRINQSSPNTVVSYARSLRLFWDYLALVEVEWRDLSLANFGAFVTWLRTGLAPGVAAIGPQVSRVSPSTVATRVAAVLSFYRYQFDAHDVDTVHRLYRRSVTSAFTDSRYGGMLAHLQRPGTAVVAKPMFQARIPHRDRTPMLTPAQCATLIRLAQLGPDQGRAIDLRDRLLFSLLHQTGMRLGEALAVQHRDWFTGGGVTPFIDVVPRADHPLGYRVKRGRGRRLYVSDDLAAMYGEYLWRLCDQGAADRDEPLEEGYVFVNLRRQPHATEFSPLRSDTVYAKVASIKCRSHGQLPAGFTPHWLRHTHASTLLLAGVPPHVVMRRMGHRQVQTTLETYGWVTEDAELALLANWQEATCGWRAFPSEPAEV